jgi:transposase
MEATDFLKPDPELMFIGELSLRSYLEQNGLGWVIRMRKLIEESDLSKLRAAYKPEGRKAIDPVIMLGLIIYGILESKWSLRKLEGLAVRDVGAWWMCGGLQPDHSTIGNFINLHAGVLTEEYFRELTRMILKRLHLSGSEVAGDGTVIEAVASHYNTLKAEAARQAAEEARARADAEPEDNRLRGEAEQAESAAQVATQREAKRREKGESPGSVRVSPTEPEAVVQPLKNGTARPSYKPSVLANVQKLIVGKDVNGTDEVAAVKPMLQQHQAIVGALPPRTLLDAAYNCHEVLGLFVRLDLDLLCPSGKGDNYEWEKQSRKGKFLKGGFHFDEERNCYVCPAGQELEYEGTGEDRHGKKYCRYRCKKCATCQLRAKCTSSKGSGRTIKRYDGDDLKEAMAEVFKHKRAREAYSRRKALVEPVFAELKERQGLRRFHRRGLSGVKLEFSLHCVAYNLKRASKLEESGLFFLIFARFQGYRWRLCGVFWKVVLI